METGRGTWAWKSVLPVFAVLVCVLISYVFVSSSWAVYGAPILALKHAERAERAGDFLVAAADREYAADFYKFVSIPQFQDDMEFFQENQNTLPDSKSLPKLPDGLKKNSGIQNKSSPN